MRTAPLALLGLLTATTAAPACGGRATGATTGAGLAGARGGDRIGATAVGEVPAVRARAPLAMPTCAAGELRVLASLTAGVPAHVALARSAQGALVAFIADTDRDGRAELVVQPLTTAGAARGNAAVVATGARPAHPALLAHRDGFVLAWREGEPGRESIAVASTDAAASTFTRAPARAQGIAPGWLGPPALAASADGSELVLAVARSAQRVGDPDARRAEALEWVTSNAAGTAAAPPAHAAVNAPEGGAFVAERAPLLVAPRGGGPLRVFALTQRRDAAPDDERALVEVVPGAPGGAAQLALIARDLDSPTAAALPADAPAARAAGAVLLGWRARVAAHDVAARVYTLARDGTALAPPLTVASFRGAFGAEVGFAPVAPDALGAFTISTLADDAGGTLNVSVLTPEGEYVGRQPILVSSLMRNARVVAAAGPTDVWFAFEGRGDGGAGPVLGLATVHCDAQRPADRLEVPPPSLVQRLASLDDPPTQLGAGGAAARNACAPEGTPAPFARHVSGAADALAGTDAALVALPGGAMVAFALVRPAAGQRAQLMASAVDPRGRFNPPRAVGGEGVARILAAGAVGGRAVCVVATTAGGGADNDERAAVVAVGANGAAQPAAALPIARPTSAALVPGGAGTLLVAGEGAAAPGDASLFQVSVAGGRPAGAPRAVASLRPGDRVLDAARGDGAATVVLLARPDPLGEPVARALAQVTLGARGASGGDPFADPLGYGRGDALLLASAAGTNTPVVVYSERNVVRAADLARGEVHAPRSILGVHPSGGTLLGRGEPSSVRWLAVATGFPEDAAQRVAPITLVGLGPRAAVVGTTRDFPDDPGALAERAAVAAAGDRVALLYARAERDGSLAWLLARASCPRATGGGGAGATTGGAARPAPAAGGAR